MNCSFWKFVETGSFGPFHNGTPVEEVRKILGKPDSEGAGFAPTPEEEENRLLLSYGSLDFYFWQGELRGCGLRVFERHPILPPPVKVPDMPRKRELSMTKIGDFLAAKQIVWVIDKIMTDNDQTNWVTDRDVHLVFDDDKAKTLLRVVYSPEFRKHYFPEPGETASNYAISPDDYARG